jgi:hypothetical protein
VSPGRDDAAVAVANAVHPGTVPDEEAPRSRLPDENAPETGTSDEDMPDESVPGDERRDDAPDGEPNDEGGADERPGHEPWTHAPRGDATRGAAENIGAPAIVPRPPEQRGYWARVQVMATTTQSALHPLPHTRTESAPVERAPRIHEPEPEEGDVAASPPVAGEHGEDDEYETVADDLPPRIVELPGSAAFSSSLVTRGATAEVAREHRVEPELVPPIPPPSGRDRPEDEPSHVLLVLAGVLAIVAAGLMLAERATSWRPASTATPEAAAGWDSTLPRGSSAGSIAPANTPARSFTSPLVAPEAPSPRAHVRRGQRAAPRPRAGDSPSDDSGQGDSATSSARSDSASPPATAAAERESIRRELEMRRARLDSLARRIDSLRVAPPKH